jgi:hypothetical protein
VRRALCVAFALAALFATAAPAAEALTPPALTPPVVDASWAAAVGTNSANLRAEISSGGLATTYLFEYTTEAAFRSKGFIGATKIPQTGVGIGPGLVLQHLGDLEADTAYRFRAVATNNLGITVGKVRSLNTDEPSPVFSLPDNRGWEMVSPVDKNGGEIQGIGGNQGGGVIQAAAQGGAITYTSASSFANAQGSPGPSQYVSNRNGAAFSWVTDNITLPMLSGTYPESPTSGVPYQLFSTDLASALVSNGRRCRTSVSSQCPVENPPLSGSGAPTGYRNYYLRSASGGSFKALLSSADIAGLALGPEDFEVAFAGATPDLAHTILSSCAKLTADATEVAGSEGECDPAEANLYEKTGTALKLINLLPGQATGTPGASLAAQSRAVSTDGSRVYWSDGTNLYLREGGVTKPVDGAQGGGGTFETASSDGSLAFFIKNTHLYRYAAASGIATDLTPAGDVQGVLGASEDGTYLYYRTSAGLFLNRSGVNTQVSPQVDPQSTPPATGTARLSADGHHLLFVSTAELTAYDNRNIANGQPEPEVYLFAAPGTAGAGIVCASCDPSGERPVGPASLPGASPNGEGLNAPHFYKPRVLSADSKHVFFDSFDALAVQDTNGDRDVYQWESPGAGSCVKPVGCVGLISSGRAEGGASFLDASADGSDAFFLTDGSLVSSDTGVVDVYDARVDGGFPESTPVIPCFGDACQPLPPEPGNPAPGTLRSKASGNETPLSSKSLHCKKGEVKKQGRCVKKKTRHKKPGKAQHKKPGGHK